MKRSHNASIIETSDDDDIKNTKVRKNRGPRTKSKFKNSKSVNWMKTFNQFKLLKGEFQIFKQMKVKAAVYNTVPVVLIQDL